jgi:hypothetical protein
MEVLHACCCGLDVHKETVVACVHRVIDTDVVDADLSRGVMFEEIPK